VTILRIWILINVKLRRQIQDFSTHRRNVSSSLQYFKTSEAMKVEAGSFERLEPTGYFHEPGWPHQ